jgi:hypothetical protein
MWPAFNRRWMIRNRFLSPKRCATLSAVTKKDNYCFFEEYGPIVGAAIYGENRFFITKSIDGGCHGYEDKSYTAMSGFKSEGQMLYVFDVVFTAIRKTAGNPKLARTLFSNLPFYYRWFSTDIKNFYSALVLMTGQPAMILLPLWHLAKAANECNTPTTGASGWR